jgi:arylsulfotransferase ASST
LLFDNGNEHEPPISRDVEYEIDEEDMTATLVWSYQTDDAFLTPFLGGVERLPNGNTLINFAQRYPSILEVTPDGEIVMEITLSEGYFSYRAEYYLSPED